MLQRESSRRKKASRGEGGVIYPPTFEIRHFEHFELRGQPTNLVLWNDGIVVHSIDYRKLEGMFWGGGVVFVCKRLTAHTSPRTIAYHVRLSRVGDRAFQDEEQE